MDITAIICEYNPFHKGHKYQMDKVKELYPDTHILSVMSPSFVQRGQPAIFDKFVRGQCAVQCGADLAVSMPQVFALLSAEGFAEGGVITAKKLGATSLAFGVETDDISSMCEIAEILISQGFEEKIKKELAQTPHLSYPTIRQNVLERFAGKEKAEIISTPNNILAVEYIKAVIRHCPDMELRPIKRVGNGYNDTSSEGKFLSATALRSIIQKNESWSNSVPKEAFDILKAANMLDFDRFENMLFSVISVADSDEILGYVGNRELADTIYGCARECGQYSDFRQGLSRKKFAETKINRALCNILLKIPNDIFMHRCPEYVTLLASSIRGREIIKKSAIPVISKFREWKKIESVQLDIEHLADRIWARCLDVPFGEEYFINKKPFISEDIK